MQQNQWLTSYATPLKSPTVALDRYTAGYTMAESFYAASNFVAWEDIVIGDPLCSPYFGLSKHL